MFVKYHRIPILSSPPNLLTAIGWCVVLSVRVDRQLRNSSLVKYYKANFEVFTLPHVVRPESGRTGPDNGVSRTPIFLVNCPLIFRSLSGPNSGHFPTGQFVRRTFRLDSPLDMTGQNTKLSRQGPDKDRNYHCYCY